MTKILPFVIIIVLLFNSCKENEPTAPEEETPQEVLAEATIGPEGGELQTENIIFTVPPGAFQSNADLKLSVDTVDTPYSENTVSELYTIDGMPESFNKPLRLALKYNGSLSEKSFIAIGEEVAVKSFEESTTTYCLLEATDSVGFIVANLSIPQDFYSGLASPKESAVKSWIKAVGITNLQIEFTNQGHFAIMGEKNKVAKSQLQEIGNYCEIAYETFLTKEFSYDERKDWPIPVFAKEIKNGSYGYYTASKFLKSHGYIVINTSLLSDIEELSVTIGHEFFHLVQDLYDPRSWRVKIKDFGPRYWMDEATAVYSEEFFVNNPKDYVSAAFTPCLFSPFNGFHKEGAGAGEHGYGMASVIKYLQENFLFSKLIYLYSDFHLGKHPIETIIFNSDETTDWVAPFFRDYLEGKIYKVQPSIWININLDDKYIFNISSKEDTLKEFLHHTPNLGGTFYKALLNYPDISQTSSIEFTIYGNAFDYGEISVYKYNNDNKLVFIDNSKTQVIVPDIKELTSQGWHLLGLLTNSLEDPYTGTMPYNLHIEKSERPTVTGCLIQTGNIEANVIMDYTDGSTTTEDGWYSDEFFGHNDEPTTITIFENNEYSSSFDYTSSSGLKYSGVANVKFNEEFTKIISFSVNREIQYEPDKYYGYIKQSSLSGHDIPIDPNNANNIWFRFKGVGVCDKIDQMSYQWITTGYTETKEIKSCNEDSYIEVLVGIQ